MGASGAGKTTLLETVLGRQHYQRGGVYFCDETTSYCLNGRQLAAGFRMGYVKQHDLFYPTLTVEQIVAYAAHWKRAGDREREVSV
jgi:ABC-type multidrug transport system ATPase subunit